MHRNRFLTFLKFRREASGSRSRFLFTCAGQRIVLLVLLVLLVFLTSIQAQAARMNKQELVEFNNDLRKVSSHLLIARKQLRDGLSLNEVVSSNELLKSKGSKLKVEIKLNELTPGIIQQIRAAGVDIEQSYFKYAVVRGLVAPADLDELAAIAQVSTIQPQYGAVLRNIGSVDNQADTSIRAGLARSTFGIDGTGLTIGVLSDSFYDTILGGGSTSGAGCTLALTGSDPQVSGDLPDPLVVLDNGGGGGTDEGAGMAELIADLVPGADIMFNSAFVGGQAGFASGISALAGCGADVIVDDVFYFAEPLFQDGFIAKAAQDAVDAGVPYFSSAGNNASLGVHDVFTDVSVTNEFLVTPTGVDFHAFAGGNEYAAMVAVPEGCGAMFILQWNEPFDGVQGAGAMTDLDLLICTSESAASCSYLSGSTQGDCAGAAVGDPLEIGSYTNTSGAPETVYLAVDHYCGPGGASTTPSVEFRILTLESCGPPIAFEAGVFDKMQIGGHAAAAGVAATGAVFYGEIDAGGALDPPPGIINVEPFSSLGGDVPIYFTYDGLPIPGAPELRFKPEIAAPDGTNTSFFGFDIGFDADTDPNFFGTSAAAPHAAAVAGLMLDSSPDMSPAGVNQVLMASAIDIEAPGMDTLSGFGLIDAVDAVQTVTHSGTGCIPTLYLFDQVITGSQYFRACDSITAGSGFSVSSGATLLLEAGSTGRVTLDPGFTVDLGATFDAAVPGDF